MSSLDRFTSALVGALLGTALGSDSLKFFEPVCSSLSTGRAQKTLGSGRHDDDDDDDDWTRADSVGDVETAGGACSVVCSAILTFFMSKSSSEGRRDILSCASLTRRVRATSEDMALMICVLRCSVWSHESP